MKHIWFSHPPTHPSSLLQRPEQVGRVGISVRKGGGAGGVEAGGVESRGEGERGKASAVDRGRKKRWPDTDK